MAKKSNLSSQNGEVRVYLEQKELLLTPKQYEQVFEKLEEIKEIGINMKQLIVIKAIILIIVIAVIAIFR